MEKTRIVGTYWEPSNITGVEDQFLKISDKEIKKVASADGNNGLPPVDQIELSGMQQTIWQHSDAGCKEHMSVIKNDKKSAKLFLQTNCVIAELQPSSRNGVDSENAQNSEEKLLKLQAAYPEVSAEYARLKNDNKGELVSANKDAYSKLKELNTFKVANELLEKDARYPDTQATVVATIVVALLAETIINGSLFIDIAGGLVAGAIQAFLFSAINVALGAVVGYFCLRNLFHVKQSRRRVAAFTTTVGSLFAIFWNGAVAHFREIATNAINFDGLDTQIRNVISSMLSNPFALGSLEAWGLFIVGMIIFAIVAWELYCKFDDPYPGYGPVDREFRAVNAIYEDEKQLFRDDLVEICEHHQKRVEGVIGENDSKYRQAESTVQRLAQEVEDRRGSISVLVNKANRMLNLYRDTNSFVRDGVRCAHFNKLMELESYLPDDEGDEDREISEVIDILKGVREKKDISAQNLSLVKADLLELESLLSENLEIYFKEIYSDVRDDVDKIGDTPQAGIETMEA